MKSQSKTVLAALIAGLIGGGAAYGGASILNRNASDNSNLITNSNSNGTTKVSNVSVNVSTQSEKAFNSTKNAVVSVINLQKQQSEDNGLASLFGGSNSKSNSNSSSLFGNDDSEDSSSQSKSSSNSELETASEGSGVIYKKDGNDAYIVTNNHVVEGSNSLEIILSNGQKISAKIVGKDEVTDLAVLKVNSDKITQVASFGNSDKIKVAEPVLAIGSPLGSDYATSVTQGIISAKKREVPQTSSSGQQIGNATVIQTDAAINPGNSGGPLINLDGQVIGINSMKLASDNSGDSVEGMGFSIPSNEVVEIINQLITNGSVSRPSLGISYIDLSNISEEQQSSILKLPSSVQSGAVVYKASAGSPAKKAGLAKYDVITELGGKKITSQTGLRDILYEHKVGETVSVTYYHNGKKETGNIVLSKSTSD
ncbi:S1C family serine protease [Lentilactobacillus laojiaonis]|uniref:S1C family serine protease n=1 Tax=Lentilactobacillus laojiaonis TaxID=2883998 RepID=UPI001D0BB71B|nr:trypsin-like peptidase domain-containing protein [Lentilactobacillus laojiaonis]UDM32156.1 trypsin-like peptidase domain-containing protein [Lentilactobacillus laojiaonis]